MTNQLKMAKHTPWYEEGLSFECTGCGKCCTGAPGYVWVDEEDIQKIADYLKISISQFRRQYLRQKNGRTALIEMRSRNNDCIFLRDKQCSIYSVRPLQCRTFPWWQANLSSREAWEKAAETCEGIHCKAPKVKLEVIEKELDKMSNSKCHK